MDIDMQVKTAEDGRSVILFTVPKGSAEAVIRVIRGVLVLAGHTVNWTDENGNEMVLAEDVLPEGDPAQALKKLREMNGLTQKEMARRIGVTQCYVSSLEKGTSTISIKTAKHIAKKFNIPYKALL